MQIRVVEQMNNGTRSRKDLIGEFGISGGQELEAVHHNDGENKACG